MLKEREKKKNNVKKQKINKLCISLRKIKMSCFFYQNMVKDTLNEKDLQRIGRYSHLI